MLNTILFPSSFFDVNRIDPDLAAEYEAACAAGNFRTILFGYDAWFNENRLRLSMRPDEDVFAIYRGWMMKPEQYRAFHEALARRRIHLVTTPEMYETLHLFPKVYPLIREDTAEILTFPLHEQIDVERVKARFKRFMVKDYVKSVKGTEFPAVFDDTITQEAFDGWMEVFYRYRGNLLTGGVCVKEFLPLKRYDGKTNEFRVFYFRHEVISACRNSLQANYTPAPPQELILKWRNLPSDFYTVDFAELEDGSWKIIETGDGSVSGLSDGQDPSSFFRKLYICGN